MSRFSPLITTALPPDGVPLAGVMPVITGAAYLKVPMFTGVSPLRLKVTSELPALIAGGTTLGVRDLIDYGD